MPWLTNLSEVGTTLDDPSWFDEVAREGLDRAVDAALDAAETPSPRVERLVVQGDAARALLDVSSGADLVVVGSRGRGGFTGLLLGSVSQQCATHARCPVVVVHDDPPS